MENRWIIVLQLFFVKIRYAHRTGAAFGDSIVTTSGGGKFQQNNDVMLTTAGASSDVTVAANHSPRHKPSVDSSYVYGTHDMSTKQARVLFDYDAETMQEISVRKDDVLIVYRLHGLDPDFVMAEKSGTRGRVPLSYLEIISG